MTILRRAAPTRWLYPAILLLLFMEKSSALEIAGYGGSASWTQIGFWTRTTEQSRRSGGHLVFFPGWLAPAHGWPGESWDSCDDVAVYEWQSGSSTYSRIGDNYPKTWQPSHPQRVSFRRWQRGCARRRRRLLRVRIGLDRPRVPLLRRLLATGRFRYRRAFDRGRRNVKVSISSDGKVLSVGNSEI